MNAREDFSEYFNTPIAENIAETILKAEKVIFAEALISFLTIKHLRMQFRVHMHNSYREFVCSHFTDTIQNLVREMDSEVQSETEEILDILKARNLSRELFLEYVVYLYSRQIEGDFQTKAFLYFCTHLANLAILFYREGLIEAPIFALEGIIYGLRSWDIHNRSWNHLKLESGALLYGILRQRGDEDDISTDSSDDVDVFNPKYQSSPIEEPSKSPRACSEEEIPKTSSEVQPSGDDCSTNASTSSNTKSAPEPVTKYDRSPKRKKLQ